MPEVVIVDAIDLPVDLVGACAIQRTKTADVVAAEARFNCNHLREVAPVQRNVLHHIVRNGHRLGLRGGVQGQSSGRDFDGSGLLLELELNLQGVDLASDDLYLVDGIGRKSCGRYRDFV